MKGSVLMFSKKSGNQRMCRSALPNECFCLDCLRPLDEETTFTRMFLNDDVLCSSCRSKWLEHKKIYNININISFEVLDISVEMYMFYESILSTFGSGYILL